MTRRPADIPPDVWAGTMRGQAERLERAWLRLYCQLMPRATRRRMLWMADMGPIGMLLAGVAGLEVRTLLWVARRG